MLRVFVLLLLLANGGFYAWTQGWLHSMGLQPQVQGEPERLTQQIRPELLKVLPGAETSSGASASSSSNASSNASARATDAGADQLAAVAPTTASTTAVPATSTAAAATATAASSTAAAPAAASGANSTKPPEATAVAAKVPVAAAVPAGECWQAGIYDPEQAEQLRRAAAVLPAGSWALEPATLPGRWMIYMGRLADEDAVAKKRGELRELGLDYDRPGSALEPGLSLGRFSTEEAAQRGLANLTRKGVRSARVVQERRELPGFMFRLPESDSRLRTQAQGLGAALAGKVLRTCS